MVSVGIPGIRENEQMRKKKRIVSANKKKPPRRSMHVLHPRRTGVMKSWPYLLDKRTPQCGTERMPYGGKKTCLTDAAAGTFGLIGARGKGKTSHRPSR